MANSMNQDNPFDRDALVFHIAEQIDVAVGLYGVGAVIDADIVMGMCIADRVRRRLSLKPNDKGGCLCMYCSEITSEVIIGKMAKA